MTPGTTRRFVEAAYVTALPIVVGLAADLVGIPWIALASLPLLLGVPTLRRALATHEFFVTAGVIAALAIAVLTLLHNPAVWTRMWFLGLLGTAGLSSLACLASGLRGKRGTHALAFVLIHVALPIILAGSGMKALWKVEGMIPLHEGEKSQTLMLQADGRPTGQTMELPFQVRLDRFRVEFYPKRWVMMLFDARFRNTPLGQLELTPGETLDAGGIRVVAAPQEQISRMPSAAHQGMSLTVATLELAGVPFEIPLVATQSDQAMPLPFGDQAPVAQLVESTARKNDPKSPPPVLPQALSQAVVTVTLPASGNGDPGTWSIGLQTVPEGPVSATLSLSKATSAALKEGGVPWVFKGLRTDPFSPTADDQPVNLTMASLIVDDWPVLFPLSLDRAEGSQDLPAGDSASLADMIRASRMFNSLPEVEVPQVYEHVGALFQPIQEPKMYQSKLTLLDPSDAPLVTEEVMVNEPLRHQGWWLYQADWNPEDPSFSGIHAVYDPGLWVALTGLFLLALGAVLHIRRMVGSPAPKGGAA